MPAVQNPDCRLCRHCSRGLESDLLQSLCDQSLGSRHPPVDQGLRKTGTLSTMDLPEATTSVIRSLGRLILRPVSGRPPRTPVTDISAITSVSDSDLKASNPASLSNNSNPRSTILAFSASTPVMAIVARLRLNLFAGAYQAKYLVSNPSDPHCGGLAPP